MRRSYGILLYRYNSSGDLQVFLGHASSPRYWSRNQNKIWGIPKGRKDTGEKALDAAVREFEEEVGFPPPAGIEYKKFIKYNTPHKRKKLITIFIGDATGLKIKYGNGGLTHLIQKKKKTIEYQEMDNAKWFGKEKAIKRIMWGQRGAIRIFFQEMESKIVE